VGSIIFLIWISSLSYAAYLLLFFVSGHIDRVKSHKYLRLLTLKEIALGIVELGFFV
jgi:hypothetical protein